jgi:hypothetical protein
MQISAARYLRKWLCLEIFSTIYLMYRTLSIGSVPSSSEVVGKDRAALKTNKRLRLLLAQELLPKVKVRNVLERLKAKLPKDQECQRPSALACRLKAKPPKDRECLRSLRRLYKIKIQHRQLLLNP